MAIRWVSLGPDWAVNGMQRAFYFEIRDHLAAKVDLTNYTLAATSVDPDDTQDIAPTMANLDQTAPATKGQCSMTFSAAQLTTTLDGTWEVLLKATAPSGNAEPVEFFRFESFTTTTEA